MVIKTLKFHILKAKIWFLKQIELRLFQCIQSRFYYFGSQIDIKKNYNM